MATTTASYIATDTIETTEARPLSWGAILAGAFAALAAHMLITLFAVGLGVQMLDITGDAEPVKSAGIGAGVAWSISALISLWIGGWIAGRFTPGLNRRAGALHGALVWALATVVTATAFTGGAGLLAGAVAKVTGKTMAATGQVVAAGAAGTAAANGDFVSQLASQNANVLGGFVRELVPASAGDAAEQTPETIRQTRELTWALIRFFTNDAGARSEQAKTALIQSISQNTDLNESEARARVDQMIASYDQIQNDLKALSDRAAARAREMAERASDYVTQTAVWTFIAFVIGAISAAAAGSFGAKARIVSDANASNLA